MADDDFYAMIGHFVSAINEISGNKYQEHELKLQKHIHLITNQAAPSYNFILAMYYANSQKTRDMFEERAYGRNLKKDSMQCEISSDIGNYSCGVAGLCALCMCPFAGFIDCASDFKRRRVVDILRIKKCGHYIHRDCLSYEIYDCLDFKRLRSEIEIDCIMCHILCGAPIKDFAIVNTCAAAET